MTTIRPQSKDDLASVLHYETALGFGRRTKSGWDVGLPKRLPVSGYQRHGNDGKILEALHSAYDRIKAPFNSQAKDVKYIPAMMSVFDKTADVLKELGPSLWCGGTEKTPIFIDSTSNLDFSVEADRFRFVVSSGDCKSRLTPTVSVNSSSNW